MVIAHLFSALNVLKKVILMAHTGAVILLYQNR